jgi:hypothetical protein
MSVVSDSSSEAFRAETQLDLESEETGIQVIVKQAEDAAFGMLFTLVKDNSLYKKLVAITILVEWIRKWCLMGHFRSFLTFVLELMAFPLNTKVRLISF